MMVSDRGNTRRRYETSGTEECSELEIHRTGPFQLQPRRDIWNDAVLRHFPVSAEIKQ